MNISPISMSNPARAHAIAHLVDIQTYAQRCSETFKLMEEHLPVRRRMLRAGDSIYQAGERFSCLHIVHSGFVKAVNLASDGREQVVALYFKGDWLGFDGISSGSYGCDHIALDIGEVWSIRYDTLLQACNDYPPLLTVLHGAMSQEIARDRDRLMSLCTLSADARVAEFLRYWAESLERRGLRTDEITLRMTRAEIGSYLGMTLESVSRALSRLAKEHVICFAEKGRRQVQIPDVDALACFVQRSHGSDQDEALSDLHYAVGLDAVADIPLKDGVMLGLHTLHSGIC